MGGFRAIKGVLPGSSASAGVCEHNCKRTTQAMFRFDLFSGPVVWTHKSCVCNEMIALLYRHQFDDGFRYSGKCLKAMFDKYCGAYLVHRVRPVSEEAVIAHAVPTKRRLLQAAQRTLVDEGLTSKDGRVKMFLKDDKYSGEYKPPRCIQYRNKRYCLRLARWMIPIERMVYTWLDASGTPIFAKARNMRQRGRDIAAKFSHFHQAVAISMDHSKFDSHVNPTLLALEHWFYNRCARDKELAWLLDQQRINKGSTKHGTRYVTVATRMSGDQNTGLGNCLINFAMTRYILEQLKVPHCLYIDGDDFIVFCSGQYAHLVRPELYAQFGMKTTLDSTATRMEHIEFCQTRPVVDGLGSYTMVRNPRRLLTRVPWIVGPRFGGNLTDVLYSTGRCEMALGMGLPVAQYVGLALSQKFKGKYVRTDLHYRAMLEKCKPLHSRIIPPSAETRLSYEVAWGVDVALQEAWESMAILDPEGEAGLEYPLSRFRY